LADQEVEVGALLVGEFEEHLLAFRFLEPLAVALEELVGAALAADADEQRLLIVDAARPQLLGALGEETARGSLEEQKRRVRLERGTAGRERRVPRLERRQVLALFAREPLEDAAAARIARHPGGARVELEAAALGRNRDPQRVAREDALGRRAVDRRGGRAGPAGFADAVDLDDGLRHGEASRLGHFFDERLDVGAQKLRGSVAARADQMKVAGVTVRRFVT